MITYIKKFSDIGINNIAEVGGKNASLGEMFNQLIPKGINIPDGFAVTANAYQYFIEYNQLQEPLQALMNDLDKKTFLNLETIGKKARDMINLGSFPDDLKFCITDAYDYHFNHTDEPAVAVRSSATAEDLPEASFAGQHESFLNIKGHSSLLSAVKKCYASLYTNRAIKYREEKGFEHNKIFLSVGVQLMVRSDIACSGIGFTLEPESGFRDVIHIAGVWGLGENIVQGNVTPDEFLIFKPSLKNKKKAIIQKNLGSKTKTMVYAHDTDPKNAVINLDTPWEAREKFVLTDNEVENLANWALLIEDHYKKPMDFEWAKDGINHQMYIIQARPETVHSHKEVFEVKTYHIDAKTKPLISGAAIGCAIACGYARLLSSPKDAGKLKQGDILVTEATNPDSDPILQNVAGIVTNKGGRTSHAAIIARELGAVAIVGTENATNVIKDGDLITLSCAEGKTGYVYPGKLNWTETTRDMRSVHLPDHPKAQLIIGEPEKAFELSFYPNHGVGLMRLEFIISNYVQIHPMALVKFNELKDEADILKIKNLTKAYPDKTQYFVDKLAQGVATIAAAFYPKEVIVRMSDFKTNEYAGLIGGKNFEPHEENPMLGFRGASRYYHERYREGFKLECEAIKVVRKDMGFTNVKLMIPFCRTVEEGKKVTELMAQYGLKRGENGLEIYVMAEIPSNVLLADDFAGIFDGFSIGSNDLTQLTLGIDRDSELVAGLFDEQNKASKKMILTMINTAHEAGKKVGLCGQAPSDSNDFANMLIGADIDSISFNPDALLKGIENINQSLLAHKAFIQ